MKKSHSKTLHCALLLAASLLMTPSLYAEPPVQVYIMAGQSNMQGKGSIEGDHGGSSARMSGSITICILSENSDMAY